MQKKGITFFVLIILDTNNFYSFHNFSYVKLISILLKIQVIPVALTQQN